jgi:hypothetical protein
VIPDRFAQRFGPGDAVRLGVVLILVVGTLAPAVGAVSVNDVSNATTTPSDTDSVADDGLTLRQQTSPRLTVTPLATGGFRITLINASQPVNITVNGAPVGSVNSSDPSLTLSRSELRTLGDGLKRATIAVQGTQKNITTDTDLRVLTPASGQARVSERTQDIIVPVSPVGFSLGENTNVELSVSGAGTTTSVRATLSPNQSGYGRLLVNPADFGDLAYPPGPINIHGVSLGGENLSEGAPSLSVPLGSLADDSTDVTSQGDEVVINHLLINSGETYNVTFRTQQGTLTRSVGTGADPTLRVTNSASVVRRGSFDVSVSHDGQSVIRGYTVESGGSGVKKAHVRRNNSDELWNSTVNVTIGSTTRSTVETVWVNATREGTTEVRSYSDVTGTVRGQNLTLNFSEAGVKFRPGGQYDFVIQLQGSDSPIRASTGDRGDMSEYKLQSSDAGTGSGSGLGVPGDSNTVVLVTLVGVVAILAGTGGAILYTRRTDDDPMAGTGTSGTSKSGAGAGSGPRSTSQPGTAHRRSIGGPDRERGPGGAPGSTGRGGGGGVAGAGAEGGRIQQVPVTVSIVDALSGNPITRELNYEAGIRSQPGQSQTGTVQGGQTTIQFPAGDCFVAVGNQMFREEAVVNTNRESAVTIEVAPVTVDLQIVDENKRPIRGATVTCSPVGFTEQERSKRTDNRGNARLDVPRSASRVRIEATAEGYEGKSFEQELDPPVKGKVSLLEAPSEVRVTVTVDGDPAEGVPVTVEGSGEGDSLSAQQSTDTDADGSVRFGGLRAGTYAVEPDVDTPYLDVPRERIDLGRGATREVRLRVSSRFELSAGQRDRVRSLRSRIEDLSAASDRDTAIPHYFGTVLESLLDLIETFPEQAGQFSLAGHDPDRLVTSLLDSAEDATGAIETAMRSKRSVDLFSVCASLPAAEVDWSSDYQTEALRALLDGERDPDSQFEARLGAVRSTLDDQQRSLTDISPIETLYEEIESEFDTPDSNPDFDSDEQPVEAAVSVFVALGVLAAIESLFDHEPLRERLDQTVF